MDVPTSEEHIWDIATISKILAKRTWKPNIIYKNAKIFTVRGSTYIDLGRFLNRVPSFILSMLCKETGSADDLQTLCKIAESLLAVVSVVRTCRLVALLEVQIKMIFIPIAIHCLSTFTAPLIFKTSM